MEEDKFTAEQIQQEVELLKAAVEAGRHGGDGPADVAEVAEVEENE